MFYVNLLTKQYIEESSVIKETDNGIVYYQDGCWKYLSADKYEKTEYDTGTYTVMFSEKAKKLNETAKADTDITQPHIFYTNYFGLNRLELSQRKYRSDSGVMTEDMSVIPNKPIKVIAKIKMPEKTSVEISIIDGNMDMPILPQGETNVVHEKVFLGMSPRFKSDKYSYYRDFKGIGNQISENDLRISNSLFTVCYKPSEEAYLYTPKHSTVKVKVILRMYSDNAEPPEVNSIVLSQGV